MTFSLLPSSHPLLYQQSFLLLPFCLAYHGLEREPFILVLKLCKTRINHSLIINRNSPTSNVHVSLLTSGYTNMVSGGGWGITFINIHSAKHSTKYSRCSHQILKNNGAQLVPLSFYRGRKENQTGQVTATKYTAIIQIYAFILPKTCCTPSFSQDVGFLQARYPQKNPKACHTPECTVHADRNALGRLWNPVPRM